jgi:hypothetical protein
MSSLSSARSREGCRMRKHFILFASMAILALSVALYGCEQIGSPSEEAAKKPEKVVVNEGLSKEEEKDLSQRLQELEKKVEADSQGQQQVEESSTEGQTEADLVEAVEDYYLAVDRADWTYTYEHLDAQTKSLFDEEEWYSKNQYFADTEGLDLSTMDVQVNGSASNPVVGVTVYRTFDDGTSIDRDTVFVLEDASWKHRFVGEELELYMPEAPYEEFLAFHQGGSPSTASATATAAAQPAAEGSSGTKHVQVVVTSDVPVDVSIVDDNFDVSITEQITGSKTYEFDVAADSGLLVDAMNMEDMAGNVSIAVYENGELKTQDSDSSGYAQVMY